MIGIFTACCLTDIDLVTTYFRLLADRVGGELKPEVFDNVSLKNIVLEYFNWKITWPFRSLETNRLGKYYFDGSQYMISYIDYAKFGREISPLNAIFLSLSSSFKNAEEIETAENLIWSNIENFISTYQALLIFIDIILVTLASVYTVSDHNYKEML